jgi:hypothetical protein
MVMRAHLGTAVLAGAIGCLLASAATAGSFVYEGQLEESGTAASGRYDFEILPYADAALGGPIASAIHFEGVEVVDGRFRLGFDLPAHGSDQVWLALAVRNHGSGDGFAAFPTRTKAIEAGPIGLCWSSAGDSNTNPSVNFLGTTDAQPLVLRTANAQSLRIEPSSITFGSPALPITTNSIGGSHANTVTTGVRGATIAGGGVPSGESDPDLIDEAPNRVTDHYGTVSGGYANRAGDDAGTSGDRPYATVGGGRSNTAYANFSFVGGGEGNRAFGANATVGGGSYNNANASQSTIGGGFNNFASGPQSAIGGGLENIASGTASAVGGGSRNIASGLRSTIAGGDENAANGFTSAVGGGLQNCAGSDYAWAGGRNAKVRPAANPGGSGACSGLTYPGGAGDSGTFVWADGQGTNFLSTGANQFLVRATGGVALNGPPIDAGVEFSAIADNDGPNYANLFLRQRDFNAGVLFSAGDATSTAANNAAFYIDQFNAAVQTRRLTLESDGDLVVSAQAFKPGGGAWSATSDARLKTDVEPLTGALDRLLALRGTSFEYRADATPKSMYLPGRQIGFIAQEVEAVFPQWVGETAEGFKTVGPQGFEALTVEALRELRAESALIDRAQQQRIERAERENAALRAELAELRATVAALARESARRDPER